MFKNRIRRNERMSLAGNDPALSSFGLLFFATVRCLRIALPYGSSVVSGKLGSNVFARNKAGLYIRRNAVPVVPNSTRQMLIKTRMTVVSQAYQGLDSGQLAAWDTYAKNVTLPDRLGGRAIVSGNAMFVRTNMARLESGEAILEDAPVIMYLGEKDDGISVSISEATQLASITFTATNPWCTEADAHMLVYMGQPQNPTRMFYGNPWKYAGKIDGANPTGPTSPQTIAVPVPIASGQKVWFQFRILRADGRLSDPFRASCTAGA